jgi:protein TonB
MKRAIHATLFLSVLLFGHAVAADPTLAASGSAADNTPSGLAGVDLHQRGREAMRAGRMLAPAGDSALEYYVQALEHDRHDLRAQSAMDDLYAFVTSAIDGALERGDVREASRLLGLLERGRPESVVAQGLRARLDRIERNTRSTGLAAS